jgi:diguanylate cyclase (GGDEF)-like protein
MEKYNAETLQNDEFFLFYEMMMLSLKTDDVKEGLNQSLFLVKLGMNCDSVFLHRKNEEGKYKYYDSNIGMFVEIGDKDKSAITCLINKTSTLAEAKGDLSIQLDFSEDLRDVRMIHIKTHDNDYILTLKNSNKSLRFTPDFYDRLNDTLQVILKRAESYEKNTLAMSFDLLTGLGNRNSYERKIDDIYDNDEELTYVLFDLFRSKYINDTFNHSTGDKYIAGAAKVLDKYWPRTIKGVVDGKVVDIETGNYLYRIGGDEFALITRDRPESARLSALLAAEEVKMLDLGLGENIPVGLNFGVVKHKVGESIKDAYDKADELMQMHKKEMYQSTGLDRRR